MRLNAFRMLFVSILATFVFMTSTTHAVITKPVSVEPGDDKEVTFDQLDPEGQYAVEISPSGPKLKSSSKILGPGKALWQGPNPATDDLHKYTITYPDQLPPGVLIKGDFKLEGGGPGPGPKNQFTVDVQDTFKVQVKNIKFTSDHQLQGNNLLKDNNNDWTDAGDPYAQPEWDPNTTPPRNSPISHTKDVKLTIDVTVKVEPSGTPFDLIGDGPDNYVDFTKAGNTSTGNDQTLTITADEKLPNQVDTLTKSITWKIRLTDPDPDVEIDITTTGPHKIYVTWGTPSDSSVVTEKRLSWACSTADNATTLIAMADAIYTAFDTPPPCFELGATPPSPLWLLMAGCQYKGECIDLAKLMKLAVEILGGTASIGYIYGSTDTDCYSSSPSAFETRTCPGGQHGAEEIYVWSAGGWNNWEAVCVVSGKYYAIQVHASTAPVDILRTWLGDNTPAGNYQAWLYGINECSDPGPRPVPKP